MKHGKQARGHKTPAVILGALIAITALGGCSTYTDVDTSRAEAVREAIAKHCVVGRMRLGNPSTTVYVREGEISKRISAFPLQFRQHPNAENITVFSIQERVDGWLAADTSAMNVRENFYFQPRTGAFACSYDEWNAAVGSFLKNKTLETDPALRRL